MKKFILTTAIGGLRFLVPLVFVVVISGKAFNIMTLLAEPPGKLFPLTASRAWASSKFSRW